MKRFFLFLIFSASVISVVCQIPTKVPKAKLDSLIRITTAFAGYELADHLNVIAVSLSQRYPDSCMIYANQALELSQKINYQRGISVSLFNFGNGYYFKNDIKNALLNYLEALKTMKELEYSDEYGNLLLQIGFIHYFSGSQRNAKDYYKKALMVFDQTKNDEARMFTCRMIGIIYWDFNQCDSALMYDTVWLNYYEKSASLDYYAMALSETGVDLICLNDTLGLHYEIKALDLAFKTSDNSAIGLYSSNLGYHYLDSTKTYYNPQKGEFYLLQSIDYIKKTKQYYLIARLSTTVGGYYFYKKDIAKAQNYLNDALIATDSFNISLPFWNYRDPSANMRFQVESKKTLVNVYDFYLKIYKQKGDYLQAMKYQDLKKRAEDSVYSYQVRNQFDLLEATSENEQKENQIQLLSQRAELQERKIKLYGFVLIGLSILSALIILIIFLVIRQSRMKVLQDKIILEQKLLRSQMNPHFIFNSLASIQNSIINEEPRKASKYLTKFSRLVRNILDSSIEEFIPLEREISTIENYLELQKIRFPEKFDYSIEVDERLDPESVQIPPMLAQPFIENAIEHGIKHKASKGKIDIRFKLQNGTLELEVEDDGIGRQRAHEILKVQDQGHKSMATAITVERIKILNKKLRRKILMEIIDLKNNRDEATGTKVGFEIPLNA